MKNNAVVYHNVSSLKCCCHFCSDVLMDEMAVVCTIDDQERLWLQEDSNYVVTYLYFEWEYVNEMTPIFSIVTYCLIASKTDAYCYMTRQKPMKKKRCLESN